MKAKRKPAPAPVRRPESGETADQKLGGALRKLREAQRLKQDEVAALVREERPGADPAGLTQSALARLEAGLVAARPDPLFLQSTFYTGNEDFFVSNAATLYTLPELAQWERGLANSAEPVQLWVIAPDFVDDENNEFLEIIVELLKKKATITYFVDEHDIHPLGRFDIFIERVVRCLTRRPAGLSNPSSLGNIRCYGLTSSERAWVTSSLVISNPEQVFEDASKVQGFTIVSIDGKPKFGFEMSATYLRRMAIHILRQVEIRSGARDQGASEQVTDWKPIWRESALKGHASFTKAVQHAKL